MRSAGYARSDPKGSEPIGSDLTELASTVVARMSRPPKDAARIEVLGEILGDGSANFALGVDGPGETAREVGADHALVIARRGTHDNTVEWRSPTTCGVDVCLSD